MFTTALALLFLVKLFLKTNFYALNKPIFTKMFFIKAAVLNREQGARTL